MTAAGTPDDAPNRVVQLPVRDVNLVDPPPHTARASVTRLPNSAERATSPPPIRVPDAGTASAAATPHGPTAGEEDDAVVALLSARLGFQAATAAAARVRLPSLADFLA